MRYYFLSYYILRMGFYCIKWKVFIFFFFIDGIRFRCMKNKDILYVFENKMNFFIFYFKGELLNMN